MFLFFHLASQLADILRYFSPSLSSSQVRYPSAPWLIMYFRHRVLIIFLISLTTFASSTIITIANHLGSISSVNLEIKKKTANSSIWKVRVARNWKFHVNKLALYTRRFVDVITAMYILPWTASGRFFVFDDAKSKLYVSEISLQRY